MFVVHQFLPDHGDLRHGSAPGEGAELEKAQEQLQVRFMGNSIFGIQRIYRQSKIICRSGLQPDVLLKHMV